MNKPPLDSYPHLVGDIGGTHARFALVSAPGAPPQATRTLRTADFAGPAAVAARAHVDTIEALRGVLGV